jgi:hypothetical protein
MKRFIIAMVLGLVFLSINPKSAKAVCGVAAPCPPTSAATSVAPKPDGGGKKKKPTKIPTLVIFTSTSTATPSGTPTNTPTNTSTATPSLTLTITPTSTFTQTAILVANLPPTENRDTSTCPRSLMGLFLGIGAILAGTSLRFLAKRQTGSVTDDAFGYSHSSSQARIVDMAFGSGSQRSNDRLEGAGESQGKGNTSLAGALQISGGLFTIFGIGSSLKLLPCSWELSTTSTGIGIIVLGIGITVWRRSRIGSRDRAIHAADFNTSIENEKKFFNELTEEISFPASDRSSRDSAPLDTNDENADDVPRRTPD